MDRQSTGIPPGGLVGPDGERIQSSRPENRLAAETSPYLLQHAHNPVDWYPWGEEAFARAQAEDKPIFLSVGYAACHWCHVMERESFENEEIANRVHKSGRTRVPAYLEDHAGMIQALVDLYEATLEPIWLTRAIILAESMRDEFEDVEAGGYYSTGARHDGLIVRLKTAQDSSTPSGNSLAATALFRLSRLTGRTDLEASALRTAQAFCEHLDRAPGAFHQMLLAVDLWLGPRVEVVFAGSLESAVGQELRTAVDRAFLPRAVVAHAAGDPEGGPLAAELVAEKAPVGEAAVYVCRDFACAAPCASARDLTEILEKASA